MWGDTVNWEFLPSNAINDLTIMSNNPVFGLNAIGGALSIGMKDGFLYQGAEIDGRIAHSAAASSAFRPARSPAASPVTPLSRPSTTAVGVISRRPIFSACMQTSAPKAPPSRCT